MPGSTDYFLGMAPEEIDRLTQQHGAWRCLTDHVWDLAGIGPGQTVVDLGSGPGLTTIDLARRVGPGGRVVAVDASATAIAHLRQAAGTAGLSHVDGIDADVYALDLGRFEPDAVTARWLFWVLSEPAALVDRVAAALKPGAIFAVMDYCNYHGIGTEPSSPLFECLFRAVARSCSDAGGSLDVAGRLPAMMRAAGLRVTQVTPLQQVARPGSPVWQWVSNFQRVYFPTLAGRGYVSEADVEAFRAWWSDLERNPDALFFAPPMLGVVAVKPD